MRFIYPVTIFLSRYGGVYEGAKWIATNMDDEQMLEDMRGDDVECREVFELLSKYRAKNDAGEYVLIGRGSTPDDAYRDLKRKFNYNKLMDV